MTGTPSLTARSLTRFGGLAVDLAIAEHVQAQTRDREAGFDAPLIDVDACRATRPRDGDAVRTGRAQMHELRAALDGDVRAAQNFDQPRCAGSDEPYGVAGGDPRAHGFEEHRRLAG